MKVLLFLSLAIFCSIFQLEAISTGSLSDFEDGTTQNWAGGASPANIATGGPAGDNDNFLQIGGGGSNLASFNRSADWTGNYITAGVVAVSMILKITAGSPLEIRIVLFGSGTGDRWTSTDAFTVPADGEWHMVTFSLGEADLTQAQGIGSYTSLMSAVERLMIRYDPGGPSATGTSAGATTLGIDNIQAENALPVELIEFRALAVADKVTLSWSTASEIDNDFFAVERSNDAATFHTIGIIDGHGTTLETQLYSFIDQSPFFDASNYYRLRQVDYNGKLEYSKIVAVDLTAARDRISVFPNPVERSLTVRNGKGTAAVYNVLGRIVKTIKLSEGQFRIEVEYLPEGWYFLHLANGQEEQVVFPFFKI